MELLTRLLSSCDIPPFGNQPYDTGWSAARGTTPLSVTCPIADLAKAPSHGFASTIFSPDSTSAPELFEQVIASGRREARIHIVGPENEDLYLI